jgi:hypothetical protein
VTDKASTKRVEELVSEAGWEMDHLKALHIIRAALCHVIDRGTAMDTGCGPQTADMWLTIGGVEYYMTLHKSNNQLDKEAG